MKDLPDIWLNLQDNIIGPGLHVMRSLQPLWVARAFSGFRSWDHVERSLCGVQLLAQDLLIPAQGRILFIDGSRLWRQTIDAGSAWRVAG